MGKYLHYMIGWLVIGCLLVLNPVRAEDKVRSNRVRRASPRGAHLQITSIMENPYLMRRLDSNDQFEGFIPDLLAQLSSSMGFNYTISLVRDGRYGTCPEQGDTSVTCTGMIGEVQRGEADVAAAPITVTLAREQQVDFIWPFQQVGLRVLVRVPPRYIEDSVNLNVFRPLRIEVYLVIFLASLVVGLILWLMNRFNPYEWGRQRADDTDKAAADSFRLPGSLWFAWSSLQWQGYERAPRSLSSRTLAAFWFAFITVTLATYIGGLVNHVSWHSSIGREDMSFTDMSSLVESGHYDYGCVQGGSTCHVLQKVQEGRMYDTMRAHWKTQKGKNSFVKTTAEGVHRVHNADHYAFVMESTTADYVVNRDCNLTTLGGIDHQSNYGFAVGDNFPYHDEFNFAILRMLESGAITRLIQKWWGSRRINCPGEYSGSNEVQAGRVGPVSAPKRLGLGDFWAPLALLVVGIIVSLLVALAEICFSRNQSRFQRSKNARSQQTTKGKDGEA